MPPPRSRRQGLLLAALACLLGAGAQGVAVGAPETVAAPLLKDGVATRATLAADRTRWEARVEVPTDAVALGVVLAADAGVDLSLRHLRPLEGPDSAEVASRTDGSLEAVTLTPFSEVPLRSGTWHVLVSRSGGAGRAVVFDVIAFVDRAAGPHTVLPGRAVSASLAGEGGHVTFRTFLPRDAVSLALDVSARDAADLLFDLRGPEGYHREGPGAPRLLVSREEAPAGAFLLTLTAPAPRGARRVTAEARWDLGKGRGFPAASDPLLEPGQPLTFVMGGRDPDVRSLRIEVPRGTSGFSLEAQALDGADVDLYVRRAKPLREGIEDAEWLGITSGPREHLHVGGLEPLPPGTYFAWAVLVDDARTEEVTLSLERLRAEPTPGSETARSLPAASAPTLPEGLWVGGTVRPDVAGITWHAVDLPAGTAAVHARLIEGTAPLDLVLARPSDGAILARALSARVDEPLVYDFERPLDRGRRFLIGVLSRESAETIVHYRLAVSPGRAPEPPDDMAWPPVLPPTGLTPLERAAAATVELTTEEGGGGSGTCVTPGGLLLSCRHVLEVGEEDDESLQRTGILVAFVQRLDGPPTQAYLAQVVAEDAELDLALLAIVADVFGRPLPADAALPWVPLGDAAALRLGDTVLALGFPEGGSTRSRTAIVVSKGTVSGLERVPGQPDWVKTDAWIAPGHSGGAVVDTQGRLVAVPIATLGTGERLGLALPVSLLPAEWKSKIEKGLR